MNPNYKLTSAFKTNLIPTDDTSDMTLNRTLFNGQWVDLENSSAGITLGLGI